MSTAEESARQNGALVGAGTSAMGGALVGASIMSWSGPGAILGGIIGAIAGAIGGAIAGAGVGGAIYHRAEEQRSLDLEIAQAEEETVQEGIDAIAPWVGGLLLIVGAAVAWWLLRRKI